MATSTEVRLKDVATAIGAAGVPAVTAQLESIGIMAATNWKGEPVITSAEAMKLMDHRDEMKRQQLLAQAEFAERAAEWINARARAMAEAADAAEKVLLKRDPANAHLHVEPPYTDTMQAGQPTIVTRSPQCRDVREQAAREAGAAFERENRRPRDAGGQLRNAGRIKLKLLFITEAEEPGEKSRLAKAVRRGRK